MWLVKSVLRKWTLYSRCNHTIFAVNLIPVLVCIGIQSFRASHFVEVLHLFSFSVGDEYSDFCC